MADAYPDSDDLVALLRRTTDRDGWLDPILRDPDGGAALGAAIAVMARVAVALAYDSSCALIGSAPGGGPGSTSLTLEREATGTSGEIPIGYLFVDARGVQLRVATPVPVSALATAIVVPLQTLRKTEMVNTEDDPGIEVDAGAGVLLDGASTTALLAPPGNPAIVATTFLPGEAGPIKGGTSDWLSVHGAERGQQRQAGESTEAYRARVRAIPDAVSPIAVADGVLAAASRLGILARVLEPFDDGASAALRVQHGLGVLFGLFWSSTNLDGTAASAAASPATDFFDDAGDGRELFDRRTATAYFRVDLDGVLDDPELATMFLDGGGYWDDEVAGYPDVGVPPLVNAQGNAIWEEANRKKAGGVSFDVMLLAGRKVEGTGHATAAISTLVFSISPPAGSGWLLSDVVVGHDGARNAFPPGALLPANAAHQLRFTYSDATTFTTPAYGGLDGEHLTADALVAMGATLGPVVLVEGFVGSDGAVDVNLVADLLVLELVLP